MNYIVLDLEWNQSNTGEEPEVKEIPFEIIDFGAIMLNEKRVMIDEFNELVKPAVYQHMHRITSDLVHLHMKDLQKGRPFVEVMNRFLEWCRSAKKYALLPYGNSFGSSYPFSGCAEIIFHCV